MGQTLITKLKTVVNDDSLLKMGEVRVRVGEGGDGGTLAIRSFVEQVVRVVEGDLLYDDVTEVTLYPNSWPTAKKTGSGVISIPNKYELRSIEGRIKFDNFEDLKYSNKIEEIRINNISFAYEDSTIISLAQIADYFPTLKYVYADRNQCYGNISELLSLKTTLVNISFNNCHDVVGNFGTLGGLTKIDTIGILSTQVSGSVESFVANAIQAGRTSGTVKVTGLINRGITFNGSVLSDGSQNHNISWTSSSDITVVAV